MEAMTTPHLFASTPRRFDPTHPVLEGIPLRTDPPDPNGISAQLWKQFQWVADTSLKTDFIQGINNGTLSPVSYGQYTVQDAVYCDSVIKDYVAARDRAETIGLHDLALFLEAQRASYASYTSQMMVAWHLRDATCIYPGTEMGNYIAHEHRITQLYHPIYTIVSMIPCSMLWAWLANNLQSTIKPTSIYRFWVTENQSWHGAYALANFVDEWFKKNPYDKPKAEDAFGGSMVGECKAFMAATQLPAPPVRVAEMAMSGQGLA